MKYFIIPLISLFLFSCSSDEVDNNPQPDDNYTSSQISDENNEPNDSSSKDDTVSDDDKNDKPTPPIEEPIDEETKEDPKTDNPETPKNSIDYTSLQRKGITIDAESTEFAGHWKLKTDIDAYTGKGYLIWEGAALFWKGADNIGKTGKLTYKVTIEAAGTYQLHLRTYIGKLDPKSPNTEHNDIWIKLPDATNFYAKKENSVLYPKGSGKTPNPQGENGNGFFKAYMNKINAWHEAIGTSDHDYHSIFADFNTPGEYTIEIAPRSNFFAFDAITLIKQ